MVRVKQRNPDSKLPAKSIAPDLGASEEGKIDVNQSLERYHKYISQLARKQVLHKRVPPEEYSEEVHDLIQTTLITFWLRLISEQVQITSPRAYIGCIVRSRCIDMLRRRTCKPTLPLPVDQDGELYQGRVLLIPSEGMQDPALEFERKELIAAVIDDVLKLPPRQRYAIICVLKDEVAETFPLAETFSKHGIDVGAINWPQEPIELQRLQSSLSVAQRKLRSVSSTYRLL